MTTIIVLRILAAELECLAEILKKATPEQVQALVERHEARIAKFEAVLDKLPWPA